ncbi:hypothetical protein TRVA0_014S00496 [Trichomonascus vanleenenianus]|uniref:SIP1 domain-containing protein n=1 Tax=Trichomonascus vanleenenianus TaxID=2268995 RepID=UPI003EC9EC6E
MSRFAPYERVRYKRFKGFDFPEVDLNYDGDNDSPPWRPGRVGDLVRPPRPVKTESVETALRPAEKDTTRKKEEGTSYTSGPMDEETGQRAAFPVPKGRPNIQTAENEPPLTAADYLSSVRVETSKLPKFKSAPRETPIGLLPSSLPKKPTTGVIIVPEKKPEELAPEKRPKESEPEKRPKESEPDKTPKELEPFAVNIEWHNDFMKRFNRAREELAKYEAARAKDDSSGEPVEWPVTMSGWREFLNKSKPTLSLLGKLDKTTATCTLPAYLCKWLSPHVSEALSEWVFAVFVKIPDTVLADEMSELRRMAKKAIRLRRQTDDITSLYTIDMIVSIVAGFYYQYDLVSNLPQ